MPRLTRRRMHSAGSRLAGGKSLRQIIHDRYPRLGPKQRAVAKYLLDHQDFASFASIYEIAAASGADVSTVVRVAKSLGLAGYPQLRQELRQEYLRQLRPPERLRGRGVAGRPELSTVRQETQNLQDLSEQLTAKQIAAAGRMLLQARRILVIGTGTHATPGIALTHLGEAVGLPIALETHTGPTLAPRIASLTTKDLLVAIGFWRVSRDVVESVRWATAHRVPTLVLTDSAFSPLAVGPDLVLTAPTESVSFFQSMVAPMVVVYAVLAWVMSRNSERARVQLGRVQEINERFLVHWKTTAGAYAHGRDGAV
jgi:DNA-binding MurR/RpiR family transcriptional regulator